MACNAAVVDADPEERICKLSYVIHVRNLLIIILRSVFRICQNENGEIPERYWLLKEPQKVEKSNHLDRCISTIGEF